MEVTLMSNWIEEWSVEESKQFLLEVSQFISTLGGPLTRELTALVEKDDYVGLANYQFDYTRPVETRDLFLARQVHALFQKQEWRDIGLNPRKRAEDKFWEMEKRCKEFNQLIDSGQLTAGAWAVITRARQKIRKILGEVPTLDQLKISFGPGATTNVKGREASPRAKLNARLACSRDMLPVVGDLLAEVPMWTWHHSGLPPGGWEKLARSDKDLLMYPSVEVHPGKLSFVEKDARSMRPIVVEPILNGLAQRAIGAYMKKRMSYFAALDLTDQTRNQDLACRGSIDGSFATLDLSSASDTVSWSVVRLLLPEDWFDFLASYRTGDISIPGRKTEGSIELEKFSSMGNGYTFELESLLFFGLAVAATELENPPAIDFTMPQIVGGYCVCGSSSFMVSVYGDDIICRTEVYARLVGVLEELGFIVNNEKSFASGPFRESCGADWFKGECIRPFYGKSPWSERVLYTFHNFAIRNCEPELAAFLFARTNSAMRLTGPDGYGDGHLIGSFDLRFNRKLRRNGWGGGFFDTYTLTPRRLKKRYASDWVHPCYSVYTRASERDYLDPDIVRGSKGYAKVSLYTLAPGVFKPLITASFEAWDERNLVTH
jgi:hypothetical protein